MNKICLNMIVRNESAIILRCLNSVIQIIDYLVITDTGSTDYTIQLINQFILANPSIKGKVFKAPWINFSASRNQSIANAKQFLVKNSIPLNNVYLLFVDADMMVENLNFSKSNLVSDYYLVKQYNDSISYYNVRLARASLNLEYKSVTHEYLDIGPENSTSSKLETLQINDIGDGGCKTLEGACSTDKFARDIGLLTQGIKDEPNNSRYYFYLAQSYKDFGDIPNAIKYYTQRVQMGGWAEEIGYSYLMLGQAVFNSNPTQSLEHFTQSFESFGRLRAEPLYWAAKVYMQANSKNYLSAYKLLVQAIKLPYPKSHILFINDSIYSYWLYKELSIVCYYLGKQKHKLGLIVCDYVKFLTPKTNKDPLLISNQTYYLEPIGMSLGALRLKQTGLSAIFGSPNIPMVCLLKQTNSWIAQGIISIASVNQSYWVAINLESTQLLNKIPIPVSNPINFIIYQNKLYVFYFDNLKLVIGHLNSRFELVNTVYIKYKFNPQSNPIILEHKGLLCFISSFDPFVLVHVNPRTGDCFKIVNCSYKYNFTSWTGSAGPVAICENRQIILVYEFDSDRQIYSHRFLEYDNSFHLKRISQPFYFNNLGIEKCSTLIYLPDSESFVMFYIWNQHINKIQINANMIQWLDYNLKQKIDFLIN